MTEKQFIEENLQKIVEHYEQEGRDLGYAEDEIEDYAHYAVMFTYVGSEQELKTLEKDYYTIVRKDDLVIAETFSGNLYWERG